MDQGRDDDVRDELAELRRRTDEFADDASALTRVLTRIVEKQRYAAASAAPARGRHLRVVKGLLIGGAAGAIWKRLAWLAAAGTATAGAAAITVAVVPAFSHAAARQRQDAPAARAVHSSAAADQAGYLPGAARSTPAHSRYGRVPSPGPRRGRAPRSSPSPDPSPSPSAAPDPSPSPTLPLPSLPVSVPPSLPVSVPPSLPVSVPVPTSTVCVAGVCVP